jgi:1-acyl-sn-glycerol-3-phosphate acyltransferase
MIDGYNFDDIRSYDDAEVNQILRSLVRDDSFQHIMQFAFPDQHGINKAKETLENIHTVRDLQFDFMFPLVQELIVNRTTDGQTYSGLENLDKTTSYLFISNHRDIVLDPVLMNYLMVVEGMNPTEIAIGSNLLIRNWIEQTMKLNRSFVVQRNLPVREMLQASKKLSAYIRHNITGKNTSVWIAQREGRTKDGNDKTQLALLKMLKLSSTGDFSSGFKELKIVPLSISYELEPCGLSKVAELYKRQYDGYEKTQEDDLKSMEEGLLRSNGRVHFGFGTPIDSEVDFSATKGASNAQVEELARQLDRQIYANYKLWPNNYIAFDLLNQTDSNKSQYSPLQKEQFLVMLNDTLNKVSGDSQVIRNMFLHMYANPLLNKAGL